MNIRTRLYKCCATGIVLVFVTSNVVAQAIPGQPAQAAGETSKQTNDTSLAHQPGAVQLAAAIGIVKPKPVEKPEVATPEEPPVQQTPPPAVVEEPIAVEQTQEEAPQTATKGVSKVAIGIGVGLAALLAAVAGGGGGGGSTPPSHSTP